MIGPRLIFWEATRACNLGCPHCRASAQQQRSSSELDTGEAKKFMEQAVSFSKPILVFSGGEPLLREDIYELIRYATGLGLKATLATNATLISCDVADRLKENGIQLVSVSIYGAASQSHNRFCGKVGAFENTLKGIESLKSANVPFQINTTITRKNLNELEAIGGFALEQDADAYHIFFLVPTGRGKYIEGDEISPGEYEEAFNRICDLQQNFPLRIKATCAPHYYRVLRQRAAQNTLSPLPSPQRGEGIGDRLPLPRGERTGARGGYGAITKGCLAGQGVCFISYTGQVYGCGYLPISAGDLRKENFKDIWFDSQLFEVLRDDSSLQGRCGVCEFKKVCGGCRARAYAATGNYLAEEPECVYQPLTVRS